ncbi:hypothetical protein EVA_18725, partial [gut metagenome]
LIKNPGSCEKNSSLHTPKIGKKEQKTPPSPLGKPDVPKQIKST